MSILPIKTLNNGEKIDPYDLKDVWIPHYGEDDYVTYLKHKIYITDGKDIDEYFCYKECPIEQLVTGNSFSTHWMFPDKLSIDEAFNLFKNTTIHL